MTGNVYGWLASFGFALSLFLLTALPSQAGVNFRTVALSGEHAPGAGRGANFDTFDHYYAPSINNAGQVAFYGNLAGQGVDNINDQAIWSDTTDTLRMVIRTGQAAPKTGPDVYLGGFNSVKLYDSGQVLFRGSLYGEGVNSDSAYGYWAGVRKAFNLIARDGDPAPGTEPDTVLDGVHSVSHTDNENGQFVFSAGLKGNVDDDRDYGLWFGGHDSIQLVTREGDPAPDIVPSMNFGRWGFKPSLNSAGDIAFSAGLDVPLGDSQSGIWIVRDGELRLIALEKEPPPGLDLDATLSHIDQPTLNDAGMVSFGSYLGGAKAAWVYSDDTLKLIARTGEPAPGNNGKPFTRIFGIRTSSNGVSLINADTLGPLVYDTDDDLYVDSPIEGYWTSENGELKLLALENNPAPGVKPDAEYKYFYNSTLNDAGQVSFTASYRTPDQAVGGVAIWATDSQGQPQAIVQTGQMIDVNNDPLIEDLRTISSVPRYYDFNDAGQFAMVLRFTDGSEGVFVISTPIIGDLDNDGYVSLSDLTIVLDNWNQHAGRGEISISQGDVNGDGFVGIEDLNAVLSQWNVGNTAGSNTPQFVSPEPGTLSVLGMLALIGLSKKTRQIS